MVIKASTGRKLVLNPLNEKNVLFVLGEFIGEKLRVEHSSSKGLQGLQGIVLDEKLNSFTVQTAVGKKIVPKKGSVFFFPDQSLSIDGSVLLVRPEDRTKKLAKLFQ